MPNWRAEENRVWDGGSEVCTVDADRTNWRREVRIIAAAPGLLAACKAILAYLTDDGAELDAEKVRSAIDKAEGRPGRRHTALRSRFHVPSVCRKGAVWDGTQPD
jgi:hypothetical protein